MRKLAHIRGTRRTRRLATGIFAGVVAASLVTGAALGFGVWTTFKSRTTAVGLMNVSATSVSAFTTMPDLVGPPAGSVEVAGGDAPGRIPPVVRDQPPVDPARAAYGLESAAADSADRAADPVVRFDGRPIERVRVLRMKVTAYSPDERSCGIFADGVTASGYSVWTNAGRLVAADTDLLPFGTILRVPGYDGGRPVPVLDRGAAIRGHRLDLLFPSHEAALQWGVQELEVEVWDFAD